MTVMLNQSQEHDLKNRGESGVGDFFEERIKNIGRRITIDEGKEEIRKKKSYIDKMIMNGRKNI